jgi:hypothetical protein
LASRGANSFTLIANDNFIFLLQFWEILKMVPFRPELIT